MHEHPIRFVVQLPGVDGVKAWLDDLRWAEDAGFHAASVPDHLGSSLRQLGLFASLGAAAMATSTMRLATTVVNNDFRSLAELAKELATVDQLCDGRLVVGIGAGWAPDDYTETGFGWDTGAERIDRLAEAVPILRALLAGETVTHAGPHYRLEDHETFPRPVQQPVPLLIGGGGRRILSLAARTADLVGIVTRLSGPGAGDVSADAARQQVAWVRDAAGDRLPDIEVGVRVLFSEVGEDRRAIAERIAGERGVDPSALLDSPYGLIGPLPAIKEHVLRVRQELGISHFTVHAWTARQIAPLVSALAGT